MQSELLCFRVISHNRVMACDLCLTLSAFLSNLMKYLYFLLCSVCTMPSHLIPLWCQLDNHGYEWKYVIKAILLSTWSHVLWWALLLQTLTCAGCSLQTYLDSNFNKRATVFFHTWTLWGIFLSTRNKSAFKNSCMGEYLEMCYVVSVPDIPMWCWSSSVRMLNTKRTDDKNHHKVDRCHLWIPPDAAVVMWRMLEACSNFSLGNTLTFKGRKQISFRLFSSGVLLMSQFFSPPKLVGATA